MEPAVDIVPAAERIRQLLASSPMWAAALDNSAVRAPAISVRPLVERIASYHLVEIVRGTAVTARFALDDDGVLLEAEGIKEDGARLRPWVDAPPTEAPDTTELVWQPCDQSSSRLLPFFAVHREADAVFVRVDGATFTQLTVAIGRG